MNEDTRNYFRKELDIDIEQEFEKLKEIGKIPANQLNDRDEMMKALNEAAYNEQMAKMIYIKARSLYDMHIVEYNRKLWPLEKRAMSRIKAWMDEAGLKSRKQITKDDVAKELCAAEDTRVKYRKLVKELEEMREIRDACESLANRWKSRGIMMGAQSRVLNAKIEITMGERRRKR